MARFAIIDAGRVINHAEAEADFAQSQGWVPAAGSRIGDLWDGEGFTPAPAPPFNRQAATVQIDESVADIYGRFTRFAIEYEEREKAAQAYKDAGYTGTVPPRVAEFATPAGMSANAATDLILSQAANLRAAQGALSALRMRKYEVLRAVTDEQAQTVAAEILAGIAVIGGQVS